MSLRNEIEYFLWMKIFPIQPLRKALYLLRHRRNNYIKRFSEVSTPNDKKLMLKYLLKYGLSYEEFYWFDVKNNDPSSFVTECKRWKYFRKLNTPKGCRVYTSKGKTYEIFSDFYARALVTVNSKDDFDRFLASHSAFVYKDETNCCGKGVKLYNIDETDKDKLWEELKNKVPFIMEEPIEQGNEMAILHPQSVNTIRIVTILTGNSPKNYKVIHYSPFLKAGRGENFVDNAGSGGVICGISLDGTVTTDGIDELTNTYKEHPDTHIAFKGLKLPKFEEALELTEAAALRYTENRYVGWDLAYTKEGKWIIVEGNCFAQLVSQLCDKVGVRSELEEIISHI